MAAKPRSAPSKRYRCVDSGGSFRARVNAFDRTTNRTAPTPRLRMTESLYGDPTTELEPPLLSSASVNKNNPAYARAKPNAPIRPTLVTTWNPRRYPGVSFTSGSRPAGIHMNAPRTEAPRAAARPKNAMNRRPTSNGETGALLEVAPSPPPEQPVPLRSGFWTHHANEPAVKCPSTADTAVQVTVMIPDPVRFTPMDIVRPAPDRVTGGTSNRLPVAFVT